MDEGNRFVPLRRITIVDYGVGNIGSLVNMLDYLRIDCRVADTSASIASAESVILPGVGAFDVAMRELRARRMIDALNEAALHRKIPVLGVCLGMQILGKSSEEGMEKASGGSMRGRSGSLRLSVPI